MNSDLDKTIKTHLRIVRIAVLAWLATLIGATAGAVWAGYKLLAHFGVV